MNVSRLNEIEMARAWEVERLVDQIFRLIDYHFLLCVKHCILSLYGVSGPRHATMVTIA